MIQPLSGNSSLLQANQLAGLGQGEHIGETEHDGDSDDGAQGGAKGTMKLGALPSYLGNRINTSA
jgi:hypothetical protein